MRMSPLTLIKARYGIEEDKLKITFARYILHSSRIRSVKLFIPTLSALARRHILRMSRGQMILVLIHHAAIDSLVKDIDFGLCEFARAHFALEEQVQLSKSTISWFGDAAVVRASC